MVSKMESLVKVRPEQMDVGNFRPGGLCEANTEIVAGRESHSPTARDWKSCWFTPCVPSQVVNN